MKSIGIDIGKQKCFFCIMDGKGRILQESYYYNTSDETEEFARDAKKRYGRCRAVCESTGNMCG